MRLASALARPAAAELRVTAVPAVVRQDGSTVRRQFRRHATICTVAGVLAWLALTFVVVWFARDLDHWTVARVPAGYWWAAQGAIGGFLGIIVGYCVVMERLEVRLLRDLAALSALPDAARHAGASAGSSPDVTAVAPSAGSAVSMPSSRR